ncbi:unnamed protein product [Heligmosomoides polygyrus]|uniref:Pyridine nucleotide-disulfide oxidoreductase n=1 Tax=Heligmosomoides polygyrus TaxID=6339 RepID=A0A183G110_HELPZ|nr:unnamed protein product [Heligmosomoides polygyrus]
MVPRLFDLPRGQQSDGRIEVFPCDPAGEADHHQKTVLKNAKETGRELAVQRKLHAYGNDNSDPDVVVLDDERIYCICDRVYYDPMMRCHAMSRGCKIEKLKEIPEAWDFITPGQMTPSENEYQASWQNAKETGREVAEQRKLRVYGNDSDPDVVVLDDKRIYCIGDQVSYDPMMRCHTRGCEIEKIEGNSRRQFPLFVGLMKQQMLSKLLRQVLSNDVYVLGRNRFNRIGLFRVISKSYLLLYGFQECVYEAVKRG